MVPLNGLKKQQKIVDKYMCNEHIFSLYLKKLSFSLINNEIIIHDQDIIRRITKVLRLGIDDSCIVFDDICSYQIRITKIEKSSLVGNSESRKFIEFQKPEITLLLPLVDREQMEIAFYSAAQQGVKNIQVLSWKKSHSSWGKPHDFERAQRIMISACEQSKSFSLPKLNQTIVSGIEYLASCKDTNIVIVDTWGLPAAEAIEKCKLTSNISLCFGPEGGFIDYEVDMLKKFSICSMKLTQSILRSCDAMVLALGIIRTF